MRMSPITLAQGPRRLPKPSDTGQSWAGRRLHFVGIGGCGLSGLARLLAQRGAVCTGSDIVPSDLTEDLLAGGIHVCYSQTARYRRTTERVSGAVLVRQQKA